VYQENAEEEELEDFIKQTIEEVNQLRLENEELKAFKMQHIGIENMVEETSQSNGLPNVAADGENSLCAASLCADNKLLAAIDIQNDSEDRVNLNVEVEVVDSMSMRSSYDSGETRMSSEIYFDMKDSIAGTSMELEKISKEFQRVVRENFEMRKIIENIQAQKDEIPKLENRIKCIEKKFCPDSSHVGIFQNSSESSDFEDFGQELYNRTTTTGDTSKKVDTTQRDNPRYSVAADETKKVYDSFYNNNVSGSTDVFEIGYSSPTIINSVCDSGDQIRDDHCDSDEVMYNELHRDKFYGVQEPILLETVQVKDGFGLESENHNLKFKLKDLLQEIDALKRTVKEQSHYLSQCGLDSWGEKIPETGHSDSSIPKQSDKAFESFFDSHKTTNLATRPNELHILNVERIQPEHPCEIFNTDNAYFTMSPNQLRRSKSAEKAEDSLMLKENAFLYKQLKRVQCELSQSVNGNRAVRECLKEFRDLLKESSVLLEISSNVLTGYASAARGESINDPSLETSFPLSDFDSGRLTEKYIEGRYAKLNSWLGSFAKLQTEHRKLLKGCSVGKNKFTGQVHSEKICQTVDTSEYTQSKDCTNVEVVNPEKQHLKENDPTDIECKRKNVNIKSLQDRIETLHGSEMALFEATKQSDAMLSEKARIIETLTYENKSIQDNLSYLTAENDTLRQMIESKSPQLSVDYEEHLMSEIDELARQRKTLQVTMCCKFICDN